MDKKNQGKEDKVIRSIRLANIFLFLLLNGCYRGCTEDLLETMPGLY